MNWSIAADTRCVISSLMPGPKEKPRISNLLLVVPFEYLVHQVAEGVLAKVGGKIADANFAASAAARGIGAALAGAG